MHFCGGVSRVCAQMLPRWGHITKSNISAGAGEQGDVR